MSYATITYFGVNSFKFVNEKTSSIGLLRWPKARRLVLIDEQHAFATHLVELGEPVIIGVKGVDPVLMHDVVRDGL
jgi:hypothetical protein